MTNVVDFPGPRNFKSQQEIVELALQPLHQVRQSLRESLGWGDPTFFIRIVCSTAATLLAPEYTEQHAIESGWSGLDEARARGHALLRLIVEMA